MVSESACLDNARLLQKMPWYTSGILLTLQEVTHLWLSWCSYNSLSYNLQNIFSYILVLTYSLLWVHSFVFVLQVMQKCHYVRNFYKIQTRRFTETWEIFLELFLLQLVLIFANFPSWSPAFLDRSLEAPLYNSYLPCGGPLKRISDLHVEDHSWWWWLVLQVQTSSF